MIIELVITLIDKFHRFQFSSWIDALLLVFSLENEESFSIVCSFYNRMCSFRNMSEVPKILVGVQGAYIVRIQSVHFLRIFFIYYKYYFAEILIF